MCRRLAGYKRWGDHALVGWRSRAIEHLRGDNGNLEEAIQGELAAFLSSMDSDAEVESLSLHTISWWTVHGDTWPTLQVLAVRLLRMPCSSAWSERAFKSLSAEVFRKRNRTMAERVDQQQGRHSPRRRWSAGILSQATGGRPLRLT